jgi:hypothetical protein
MALTTHYLQDAPQFPNDTIFAKILNSLRKITSLLKRAVTTDYPRNLPCFPNDPILVKLLESAKRVPSSQVMIKDFVGFEKTYPEILSDVLKTRDQLKSLLPSSNFDERGLLRQEHVYVTALTRSGFEYVVAFFAVRSLGGAYVPLGNTVANYSPSF